MSRAREQRTPLLPGARPRPLDRREVARFLREQPPLAVPRRSWNGELPGLVALPLLGFRVVRRLGGD